MGRLDRFTSIATEDFALSDDASGLTFRGPEGLLRWLQLASAGSANRANSLRFAEIVEVCDGKVARMHAFRDTATFLQTLEPNHV